MRKREEEGKGKGREAKERSSKIERLFRFPSSVYPYGTLYSSIELRPPSLPYHPQLVPRKLTNHLFSGYKEKV